MPNVCDGADDFEVVMPLLGLCGMYDSWDKPDKSQPCWHCDGAIAKKKRGESEPTFEGSLTNESDKLEQKSAKIQQTSASAS
jgi:hypothetical protein